MARRVARFLRRVPPCDRRREEGQPPMQKETRNVAWPDFLEKIAEAMSVTEVMSILGIVDFITAAQVLIQSDDAEELV